MHRRQSAQPSGAQSGAEWRGGEKGGKNLETLSLCSLLFPARPLSLFPFQQRQHPHQLARDYQSSYLSQ